ncbi:MAG TPA: TonB-dependent receptor [Polyangiaceae bacterium]|nr:TonB-dependent receptor [Polyangiaceae bacterium]
MAAPDNFSNNWLGFLRKRSLRGALAGLLLCSPALGEPSSNPSPAPPPPPDRAAAAEPTAPSKPALEVITEVSVVGTRIERTAGSAHLVRSKDLERTEYDDPAKVLQAVPGVYARGEDGFGLRNNIGLRGTSSDRSKKVALMEDGVPFGPAPYSAPAAYYFPLMTRMTQLRVIKGPAAIVYGPQTIGGALDLITRPIPSALSGALDVAGGSYGYAKIDGYYGGSDDHNGILLTGTHLSSTGFKELNDAANTGFYRNEFMLKAQHVFDPHSEHRQELRLKLTYSEELSNETYLGLSDADFRNHPLWRYPVSALDQMKNHRTSAVLTHVMHPQRNMTVTTNAYRHDFHRTWRKVNRFRGESLFDVLSDAESAQNAVYRAILAGESDTSNPNEVLMIGPNQREFVSQGIDSRATLSGNTGPLAHRVEYGMRFHNDRIERRHSEDGFNVSGGELLPEGTSTTVTAFNEASTIAFSVHAIDAVTYRKLTVTPGVRLELMRSTFIDKLGGIPSTTHAAAHALLPGIGVYQELPPYFGVLGGVYRGFSPPAPGTEGVGPELSVNYETGMRYSSPALRAELLGYYNDYSNLTDICTLSSGCVDTNLDRQFDAGKARIYGIEAYLQSEPTFGAFRFPVSAAYTLTRTEFRNSFSSEDPVFGEVHQGDEIPYVPRHQVNGMLAVEYGPASAYGTATFISGMREQAGSAPLNQVLATDKQFVVDIGAKYRVLRWLDIYGNVRNLFNELDLVSRRPFGARPNAPRMFQIGVKLRL